MSEPHATPYAFRSGSGFPAPSVPRNVHRVSMTRYRTIVADPPWDYREGFRVGAPTGRDHRIVPTKGVHKPLPYTSMTVDEIAALPVSDLADTAGARVFMWTTNRYLPHAFSVIAAWGFDYRQTLVWNKLNPSPFSGSVAFQGAEYLIVGQRGTIPALSKAKSSVISIGVPKEHSRKPDAFLDTVEQVSPGPYLELFARRQRLGWDTWGDQALEHVDLGGHSGDTDTPESLTGSQSVVRDREMWLRENLPGLHVGVSSRGTWHVLEARDQLPLCGNRKVMVWEDGPLESTGPNAHLCSHCVLRQGDRYGEW